MTSTSNLARSLVLGLLAATALAAGVATVWPANLLIDLAGVAVVLALLAWSIRRDLLKSSP